MTRAILIMIVAMSLIPAGDTAGKLLSSELGVSPAFVAWSRFLLGLLMILPFLPRGTFGLFRDWRIWLRGATVACGITSIQFALQREDIATVFAAFFIGPLFSYLLAVIFLAERVTRLRSALILLGFIGVVIVVRPGPQVSVGTLFAVLAGLCYGAFLTQSRWLSGLGAPLSLTFTQLAVGTLMLAPFGLASLPAPDAPLAGLVLASALFSMLGNLLLVYAYRLAPATRLAPLVYLQLIAAVGFGWWVFGDLPDAPTWAGLAVIIAAGVASARLR